MQSFDYQRLRLQHILATRPILHMPEPIWPLFLKPTTQGLWATIHVRTVVFLDIIVVPVNILGLSFYFSFTFFLFFSTKFSLIFLTHFFHWIPQNLTRLEMGLGQKRGRNARFHSQPKPQSSITHLYFNHNWSRGRFSNKTNTKNKDTMTMNIEIVITQSQPKWLLKEDSRGLVN